MAMDHQPSTSNENDFDSLTLHDMFRVVGDQMTPRDIKVLKFIYNGIMPEDILNKVYDGFSFLLALEKMDRIDETNFKHILDLLRIITRHDLTPYVTLKRRQTVSSDPVSEYLESTESSTSTYQNETNLSPKPKRRRRSLPRKSKLLNGYTSNSTQRETLQDSEPAKQDINELKQKVTCDIKLRVRAEYEQHDAALSNVSSNKPTDIERQFERFTQTDTILKARDIGSIVCDIKFSELTYLDAFWRDYINGSLLEALKGVFITESLKQVVGHEAIKLLVSVDEDDYEAGRLKLLQNLK